MDGHETFVGDECDACHKDGSKDEVYLNFSIDSSLSKSCVGCHGREEDVNGSCSPAGGGTEVECGSGTGLRRMHEINVGAGTCQGCHSGDPAPVGEQADPFYYGLSGVQMQNACDADSSESRYGANGLDNDGDGQIDGADSDCPAVNSPPTRPGTLSAAAVTSSSATVSWGASSDDDSDTITYQVDYRRNGDTPWSDGGSTTSTSRPLSGLNDNQSYDVRITPNDSTEDGPSRKTLKLFTTQFDIVTFTVGGNVSDLAGTGLVLQNNGGDDEAIAGNGAFTFDTPLADGGGYAVTVKTQLTSPAQVCNVTNGSCTLAGADITNVQITCTLTTSCNASIVSGVTETSDATHEACETLVIGPDFSAEDGASIFLSSGREIWFMPGSSIETGATLNAGVCGQSLCKSSSSPMPDGCHSCVVQICDVDAACCDTAWDQACVDKVNTVCGLVCE